MRLANVTAFVANKKISTALLSLLLIGSYLVSLTNKSAPSLILTVILSIVIPLSIFLIWVYDTIFIKNLLEMRWIAALAALGLAVYGMIANTFASDFINEIYKVDPVHFPIANTFLTISHIFIQPFHNIVIYPLYICAIIVAPFAIPIFIMTGTMKQSILRITFLLCAVIMISVSNTSLEMFRHSLPMITKEIALKADFNEHFRCQDKWPAPIEKVVFLNNGDVLGRIKDEDDYLVLPCNMQSVYGKPK